MERERKRGERGGREIRELEGKKWGKKRDKEKEI